MLFPILTLTILSIGLTIAAYIVWLEFRRAQYDEQRIIDVLLVTIIGAYVGGRIGWVGLHWSGFWMEVTPTISFLIIETWDSVSLTGTILGAGVAAIAVLHRINWPYLFSLSRLAIGATVMALSVSVVLTLQGEIITVYPWLESHAVLRVPAWLFVIVYFDLLILFHLLHRRFSRRSDMLWFFLMAMPRVPFVLTGLVGWLIINYRPLWQKIRSNT